MNMSNWTEQETVCPCSPGKHKTEAYVRIFPLECVKCKLRVENVEEYYQGRCKGACEICNSYYSVKNVYTYNNERRQVPSFELYEFELNGYTATNYRHQFNKLSNAAKNECGLIKVKSIYDNILPRRYRPNYDYNKLYKSSCDLLSSDTNDEKYNITIPSGDYYTMSDYHNMYVQLFAKDIRIDKTYFTDEIICNFRNLLIEITKLNMSYINNFIPDAKPLHDEGIIFNITVESSEKIITIGDLHGGFHTFLRHMFRLAKMGVLNLDTWKINDNYMIIFLGDILDRGQHAVEILTFICRLIKENNTNTKLKIIYNRGNHETSNQYSYPNIFYQKETQILATEYMKKLNIPIEIFDDFMTSLSSAVIIKNNSFKIWLSHGGFPINASGDVHIIGDSPVIIKEVAIGKQILWNDFEYDIHAIHPIASRRAPETYKLHQNNLKDFLEQNNINFIIRGHQDSHYNSYLLSNNGRVDNRFSIGNVKQKSNITTYYNQNKDTTIPSRNAYNGPIARILLDIMPSGMKVIDDIYNIYPVITISTNTDYDRPFVHDSFGILRFDLMFNQLSTFNLMTNIYDNNKDRVELDLSIKNKYLKYKNKYMKLKKSYHIIVI